MFLRRVILQSRSDMESRLIQAKALELEQFLQTMPIAGELPIGEECPACKSEIPFRDVRTAACQNGHPWGKCTLPGFSNGFVHTFANAFSPMLSHHAGTCDFSGANVPWVYAQGVFPCSVGLGGSSVRDRRKWVDGRGATSRDPMFILWKSLCVLTVESGVNRSPRFFFETIGTVPLQHNREKLLAYACMERLGDHRGEMREAGLFSSDLEFLHMARRQFPAIELRSRELN